MLVVYLEYDDDSYHLSKQCSQNALKFAEGLITICLFKNISAKHNNGLNSLKF